MDAHPRFGNVARGEEAFTALSATQSELDGLDEDIRQLIAERVDTLVGDIVGTTKAPITAVVLEVIRAASFQVSVAARSLGRREGREAARPLVGRGYVTIEVTPKQNDHSSDCGNDERPAS